MRRRDLIGAAWLAIGLSGCTSWQRAPQPAALDTARACANWRWIGIASTPEPDQPGPICPKVPGWDEEALFPTVDPAEPERPAAYGKEFHAERGGPDPGLIRELRRFCVYEIKDRHKELGQVPFPPAARAGLVRFDQDCAGLAFTGKTIKNTTDWKTLSDRFLERAGRTKLPRIDSPPRVRLAFLDTHPTGQEIPGQWWNSGHGYALAHTARHLVCSSEDGERCAAKITTRLALPILRFDPKNRKGYEADEEHGGYIGLQSHLSDAIIQEVDSWQADRMREDAPQHLVLNLSLGWDPDLFGGLDETEVRELKAGTQAIYRALQYAASFDDVLVLAAAGNQKREPCSNRGPLLPAAWEKATLHEDQCKLRDAPLVYAVGGLRADDTPLANARPNAMPRRAACGENAVVPSANPDFPTVLLTGSSVSTAVVSSIAAVVWHFFPHLTPEELMNLLDGKGRSLNNPADFQFSPNSSLRTPSRPVSALALCSTLQSICQDSDPVFSSSPHCLELAPCREQTERTASTGGGTPAPGSCQPWLVPQPEDPVRPRCTDGCPPAG